MIFGNEWGLSELPRRPSDETWPIEVLLEKIRSAGFDGMQCSIKHASLVRKYGLRFATAGRANAPDEIDDLVDEAAGVGADCITLHAGWGMESDEEMDHFAAATLEAAGSYAMPVYFETHRATLTQDIYRTVRLLERHPGLRLNGDLSHYYCGHELTYRGFDITREYLRPILERCSFFHGRVASGETMQVDIGDGKDHPNARHFAWLWQTGMEYWLKQAKAGDVLPFAPELGPPSSGYSLTQRQSDGTVVELSDRWAQTQVIARMAKECFAAANKTIADAVGSR